MLALGAIPHVMIAMGKLPRLTGMDFDRLRHIELNPVARAAEYGLNGAEGRRLQGERFSMGRSLQKPAEPLGAVAVEAPLAERRRRQYGIDGGIECNHRRGPTHVNRNTQR